MTGWEDRATTLQWEALKLTDHPNDSRGDVAYWRLTHAQAAHHYARLSTMHAGRARRYADQAIRHADSAIRSSRIAFVLVGISLLLAVIGMVTG